MKRLTIKGIFVFLLFSQTFLTGTSVYAKEKLPDLTVSPYIKTITQSSGDIVYLPFDLTNNTNSLFHVQIQFVDFQSSSDESGTPQYFIDDGSDPSFYPRTWFIYNGGLLSIPANSSKDVTIQLNIPKNASPGGHYGGIEFQEIKGSAIGSGDTSVGVAGKIGVPILITVRGQITEDLFVKNFNIPLLFPYIGALGFSCLPTSSCNLNYKVEFKNDGNIHESPEGVFELDNIFGQKVFTEQFNPHSGYVLANSARIYSSNVDINRMSGLKFGYFTAKLILVYGGQQIQIYETSTVWIIDWSIIVLLLILISVIVYFIYAKTHPKRKVRYRTV